MPISTRAANVKRIKRITTIGLYIFKVPSLCEVLPIVSVVIFHGNDVLSLMLIKGTQQIEENLHSGLEPFNAV